MPDGRERAGTVGGLLAEAVQRLRDAGVDAPERDARLMLAHVLGRDEAWLFANREAAVAAPDCAAFVAMRDRRAGRVPLSHILGFREFWSLTFAVSPDVLTPRPDSEAVVEAVLDRIADRSRPFRILDLGTGSGCLLLALLSELPAAHGLGTDRSTAALAVAAANGKTLGLAGRVEWRRADWCEGLVGTFDIVVSNPPYIPVGEISALAPEVACHDPAGALDGGPDGLDCYRGLMRDLPRHLGPDALAVLEIGAGQAFDVRAIAAANGLVFDAVHKDLACIDRALIFRPEIGS
jgi:release factor glutamine methyltransferase